MVDPVFLFFGYGVEYSLHDLCQYLVEAGESCVEIDMLDYPDVEGALRALEGRRLVLVTSAHFLHDRFNLCFERPGCKIVSLLHVISTLRPERSISTSFTQKLKRARIRELDLLPVDVQIPAVGLEAELRQIERPGQQEPAPVRPARDRPTDYR